MHDTHAHLELFLERQQLLIEDQNILSPEAKNHLLEHIKNHDFVIQPTVSLANYKRVTSLFVGIPKIYFLLGAHPEIVDDTFDLEAYMSRVDNYLQTPGNFLGFGEIGLDYYYTQDARIIDRQKDLFRFHIRKAIEHAKPIVIHCRDAFADLFDILDEFPEIHGKFLIHCFTGNNKDLQNVQNRRGKVAYGGVVTFKNSRELQATTSDLKETDFVLETDLPFLAPHPYRGKICIPEYIDTTAAQLAQLQGVPKSKVWATSLQNSQEFFDIPESLK